jgi:hypothetical protein
LEKNLCLTFIKPLTVPKEPTGFLSNLSYQLK